MYMCIHVCSHIWYIFFKTLLQFHNYFHFQDKLVLLTLARVLIHAILKEAENGKSDFTTLQFNSFTDKGSIDFSLCNELNNFNIQLIGKALKKSTAKVPEV